jgi:hypothetical protein
VRCVPGSHRADRPSPWRDDGSCVAAPATIASAVVGRVLTLRAGDVFADRYQVVRLIKAGGMGAVYEVRHTGNRKRWALKLMHPDLAQNPVARERFQREAMIDGIIESAFIVSVIAYTLLVGTSYWQAENISELYGEVLSNDPREPPTTRSAAAGVALPKAFDAWFFRCVQNDPRKRFGKATEAIAELAEVMDIGGSPLSEPSRSEAVKTWLPPTALMAAAQTSTALSLPEERVSTVDADAVRGAQREPSCESFDGGLLDVKERRSAPDHLVLWGTLMVLGIGCGIAIGVFPLKASVAPPDAGATHQPPLDPGAAFPTMEINPGGDASAEVDRDGDRIPQGYDVPSGYGMLEIAVPSGARVGVDGYDAGVGPLSRTVLRAGYHQVRVIERNGRDQQYVIEVHSGRATRLRDALLN